MDKLPLARRNGKLSLVNFWLFIRSDVKTLISFVSQPQLGYIITYHAFTMYIVHITKLNSPPPLMVEASLNW